MIRGYGVFKSCKKRWFDQLKETQIQELLGPRIEYSVFDVVFFTELAKFKVFVPVVELHVSNFLEIWV
jgi:hypothetical protein